MDATAELGRDTRFILSMEMSRLTWDGSAEPVSRDQILRRERGQGNLPCPCPADHEQNWQPYHILLLYVWPYIQHTYILRALLFFSWEPIVGSYFKEDTRTA